LGAWRFDSQNLKCFEANDCVTTDCVGMLEPTPVGQAICDRQRECKSPCRTSEGRDLEAATVDHNAPMLRPAKEPSPDQSNAVRGIRLFGTVRQTMLPAAEIDDGDAGRFEQSPALVQRSRF